MTRTLIISDLHIGSRQRVAVLTRPAPLQRLLEALARYDRLVLLGDTVDVGEKRDNAPALAAAEPILGAIGKLLGPEREVVLVPGNHDAALVRPWIRRHGPQLTAVTSLAPDATPLLATVCAMLAPAQVRVTYPGIWLRERVWATHGHYLDMHLLPVGAYGVLAGSRRSALTSPYAYERMHWHHPSRLDSLPPWLGGPIADLTDLIRASTMPRIHDTVLHPRLAPVTSGLLGSQMRRHAIPALAEVARRLQIDADVLIFGHVHRQGPMPADDTAEWTVPAGSPRLLNSGSWLYEPKLIHGATPPHPYWPGGAIELIDAAEPRGLGLLDDLTAEQLA